MKTAEPISGARESPDPPAKKARILDFSAEFNQERWADVKLRLVVVGAGEEADPLEFWAHRLLLQNESDFFRAMFTGAWSEPGQKGVKTISFDTLSQRDDFVKLLRCIYTRKVPITILDDWHAIWRAADYFGCGTLQTVAVEKMRIGLSDEDISGLDSMMWLCSDLADLDEPRFNSITDEALHLEFDQLFSHSASPHFPCDNEVHRLPLHVFEQLLDKYTLTGPLTENDRLALIGVWTRGRSTSFSDTWALIRRHIEPFYLTTACLVGILVKHYDDQEDADGPFLDRVRYTILRRAYPVESMISPPILLSIPAKDSYLAMDIAKHSPSSRVLIYVHPVNTVENKCYYYFNGAVYGLYIGQEEGDAWFLYIILHENHHGTISEMTSVMIKAFCPGLTTHWFSHACSGLTDNLVKRALGGEPQWPLKVYFALPPQDEGLYKLFGLHYASEKK
jgi:hypothetical protein